MSYASGFPEEYQPTVQMVLSPDDYNQYRNDYENKTIRHATIEKLNNRADFQANGYIKLFFSRLAIYNFLALPDEYRQDMDSPITGIGFFWGEKDSTGSKFMVLAQPTNTRNNPVEADIALLEGEAATIIEDEDRIFEIKEGFDSEFLRPKIEENFIFSSIEILRLLKGELDDVLKNRYRDDFLRFQLLITEEDDPQYPEDKFFNFGIQRNVAPQKGIPCPPKCWE